MENIITSTNGKERIEYIDAMRGFMMLLVVIHHIIFFSFHNRVGTDLSYVSYNMLITLIQMPLFFFISGFVFYKTDANRSFKSSASFIGKKVMTLLVPTAAFMLLYFFLFDINAWQGVTHSAKMGYWFTITLFEFFVLCILILSLAQVLKLKGKWFDLYLVVAALSVYVMCNFLAGRTGNFDTVINTIGVRSWIYFIYFAFGIFIKKHFNQFKKLMDNGLFTGGLILFFFINVLFHFKTGRLLLIPYGFFSLCVCMAGIIIVFTFFYRYQSHFVKEKKLGNVLQYVGRRTLDIYLLHYFFLPQNLTQIGKFFSENFNPSLEFVVAMIFSIMVVALSLLMSNIIRVSPFLGHYLFGVKMN